MTAKKITELEKIKKKVGVRQVEALEKREFGQDDILKHYIRKNYWEKRVRKLIRDERPHLNEGIKYFSLCSKYAFDTRLFIKEKLINIKNQNKQFVFCEFKQKDFKFLNEVYLAKILDNGFGFEGDLAEIAIDSNNEKFGRFWSYFPFDVINLDYFGDIFKIDHQKIGVNDFSTIQSIIFHQTRLRRQYELWITMRAKPTRIPAPIKETFKGIITNNLEDNEFRERFTNTHANSISSLESEKLCYIGFLKWLYYVCRCSFSDIKAIEVLKYSRPEDKDGEPYNLYNILLRIEPYPVIMHSPVGDAAKHCRDEYNSGILKSLDEPIDIYTAFKQLGNDKLTKLKKELELLNDEYIKDVKGQF